MIRFFSIALALVLSESCFAFNLLGQSFNTSDNIYSKNLTANAASANSLWTANAFIQSVEFRNETGTSPTTTQRADVGYLLKNSEDEKLHLAVGGLFVDSPFEYESKLVGFVFYEKKIDQLTLSTSLEKRGLLEVQRSTSILGASLTETRFNLRANYLLTEKIKIQGLISGGNISDNNSFLNFDTSMMHGISPSWPWIWLGYGFSGLFFENDQRGYWSPEKFYNHGPRLDTSFPIYGPISGIFGGNLNFYNEDSTKGDGFLVSAGLQWGQYDGNNVRLLYTKIRSGQERSPWVYEGIQATCNLISF